MFSHCTKAKFKLAFGGNMIEVEEEKVLTKEMSFGICYCELGSPFWLLFGM
jgi:hypothetical protein